MVHQVDTKHVLYALHRIICNGVGVVVVVVVCVSVFPPRRLLKVIEAWSWMAMFAEVTKG